MAVVFDAVDDTAVPARLKLGSLDVAIVHDYLNQCGGAERVVLQLGDIWPAAPIYTSLYRAKSTLPGFAGRDIHASFLNRLPTDRAFRSLLPLYPAAFRRFGEIDADVVVASSSGWAHMARTSRRALHVVYCHTPARWLYGMDYLRTASRRSGRQALISPALGALRRIDRQAFLRADLCVATSRHVQRKMFAAYGIHAELVPPPVDVDRFTPTPRGERLLVVARLLPYKNVDVIVRAATRAGIGLDVVGDGPLLRGLRELAGPTVTLHGPVSDEVVVEFMEGCRAVCVAAEEDFGLVAVEAQAAGKPVIAYGRGGSLETVLDGVTGVFFDELTEEGILAAVAASDGLVAQPNEIAAHASQFSCGAFRARLSQTIGEALALRR